MSERGVGDNSVNGERLRLFLERVERLEEEKATLADDVKDVYAEAKGEGYDVRIMRAVVRRRRQDKDALAEQEELMRVYLRALGMS